MSEILSNLAKVLPQLLILTALSGIIGWWLRGSPAKKAEPAKAAKPAGGDKPQQDRVKNLEATLDKSKAAHKTLKAELEGLKTGSVTKEAHDQRLAELEAAHRSLETESKRTAVLEVELKKAQETIKTLNSRANEVTKAQKDRSFAMENELSKVRQQLAEVQNRPDETTSLQAEIERLRESVATSSRFAGELRKREATALEALERAQAQLASAGESARPAAARKIGPVGDTDRVAAAKAEVLRLVELNKQKAASFVPPVVAIAAAAVTEAGNDTPEVVSAAPAIVDEQTTAPVEEPEVREAAINESEISGSEPEIADEPEITAESEIATESEVHAEPETAAAIEGEVSTPETAEEKPADKTVRADGQLFALD